MLEKPHPDDARAKTAISPNVSVLPQSPRRTQRMTKYFLRIHAPEPLGLGMAFPRACMKEGTIQCASAFSAISAVKKSE